MEVNIDKLSYYDIESLNRLIDIENEEINRRNIEAAYMWLEETMAAYQGKMLQFKSREDIAKMRYRQKPLEYFKK